MGSRRAVEAATVMTDMVGLTAALHYHLTANHYPPLPVELIPVAAEAIRRAVDGDDDPIRLPDGVAYRNGATTVTPGEAVTSMHLDAFVWAAGEQGVSRG